MKYFHLRDVKNPRYSGEYRASHRWGLPGITCPLCHATWSMAGEAWPCVDLSSLPEARELTQARLEENYAEFERLREKVRPLLPEGVPLWPGATFGPMRGFAWGTFGEVVLYNPWVFLIRGEALDQLHAAGLDGIQAAPVQLRFRQREPLDLREVQPVFQGKMHPDCLPSDLAPPCERCARQGLRRPEPLILDAASLPARADVFRLTDFPTVIIGSERFVETVQRLHLSELEFIQLPVR